MATRDPWRVVDGGSLVGPDGIHVVYSAWEVVLASDENTLLRVMCNLVLDFSNFVLEQLKLFEKGVVLSH
jgi:hypothetical protein